MYCVFNETLIGQSYVQHIRQLKETREGRRYPLLKDGRAIIRVKDGLYFGEINNGETIAISNDIDEVEKRLKHADSSVNITVRYDGRNFNVEDYKLTKLPRIFRVAYSEAGDHGLIITIDDYKNGHYSEIRLFYDVDKVIKYIRRRGGKDGNFYVYGRQPAEDFRERVGGIKALDVPKQLRNIKHLQHVIIRRQSAGSHEAFIEQQRKERRDDKIISIYGNLGSIGSEQDDEYEIEDHGRYETESREEYGYLIGDYYD